MLTFVSLLCPPVENKHVLCHYANNPAFGMKKKIQKEGGKKNQCVIITHLFQYVIKDVFVYQSVQFFSNLLREGGF